MTPTDPKNMVPDQDAGWAPHMFFLASAAACVAFGYWATISTLDIVSTAPGEVVPSTRIKSVQHLEGGIIREIAVKEGQRVEKGQVLVVLEPTASSADVGELEVRINALRVEVARLEGEAAQKDKPVFDDDLARNHPELVRRALEQFEIRSRTLKSRIAKQDQTIVRQELDKSH